MLKDVVLRGYEVTRSSFEAIGSNESKGTLNYSFGIADTKAILDTEANRLFTFPALVELKAFSQEDDDRRIFECSIGFVMRFELLNETSLTEELINENMWFFENWGNSLATDLLSSLLSKTTYRNVSIPAYVNEES